MSADELELTLKTSEPQELTTEQFALQCATGLRDLAMQVECGQIEPLRWGLERDGSPKDEKYGLPMKFTFEFKRMDYK